MGGGYGMGGGGMPGAGGMGGGQMGGYGGGGAPGMSPQMGGPGMSPQMGGGGFAAGGYGAGGYGGGLLFSANCCAPLFIYVRSCINSEANSGGWSAITLFGRHDVMENKIEDGSRWLSTRGD